MMVNKVFNNCSIWVNLAYSLLVRRSFSQSIWIRVDTQVAERRVKMTNNELIKLNQIEQILNCLLALMQKQEATQKHVSILTQKELLSILKSSPNTVKSWEKTGLKRLEPPIEGTRTVYYRMEDVLTYLTP